MAMAYVKFFYDWERFVDPLPDEEAGQLFKAILAWGARQQDRPVSGTAGGVFQVLKTLLDRDRTVYRQALTRPSGKEGGMGEEKDEEKDHANENENDHDPYAGVPAPARPLGRPVWDGRDPPPTPQDIRDRVQKLGLTMDPNAFYDYYAARGWRMGRQPMRDLDAALRTWARRQTDPGRTVSAQQYAQRPYTESDLTPMGRSLMDEAVLETND